jgi:fructosamine-3-kinase
MLNSLSQQIESALGEKPERFEMLPGGCIGEVYRVRLSGSVSIVAKAASDSSAKLSIEGYMLSYLKEHSQLPVPAVLHSADTLLLMEFIEGDSDLDDPTQYHAAELIADLHSIRGEVFGLERDTLIGGLNQPNPPTESWIEFFREHRLLYMGREAARSGRMPENLLKRVEKLSERLDQWLLEPEHPSLLHGDMWTTNILAAKGRITGFIDPAIYYGHPEIELAFSTLFNTFGSAFFRRYQELRRLRSGFFEVRRDIYNLYPLLVHVRLFGGDYVGAVERILKRFGC